MDRIGGQIGAYPVEDFDSCMDLCSTTDRCVGVAYNLGSPSMCDLRHSDYGFPIMDSVWGAVAVSNNLSSPSSVPLASGSWVRPGSLTAPSTNSAINNGAASPLNGIPPVYPHHIQQNR